MQQVVEALNLIHLDDLCSSEGSSKAAGVQGVGQHSLDDVRIRLRLRDIRRTIEGLGFFHRADAIGPHEWRLRGVEK
jgi:hypothetical protein